MAMPGPDVRLLRGQPAHRLYRAYPRRPRRGEQLVGRQERGHLGLACGKPTRFRPKSAGGPPVSPLIPSLRRRRSRRPIPMQLRPSRSSHDRRKRQCFSAGRTDGQRREAAQHSARSPRSRWVSGSSRSSPTTLGETGGDAVTMSMNLGYALGTLIFLAVFVAAVAVQIRVKSFNAYLYWLTIVATTTVGTTIADFADRSLGIGYFGGSTTAVRVPDGVARAFGGGRRARSPSIRSHAESRGVLLGDDPLFADARHGARRLGRRHQRSWLCGRRNRVRRAGRRSRRSTPLRRSHASACSGPLSF